MKKNKVGVPIIDFSKDKIFRYITKNCIRIIRSKYDSTFFIDRVVGYVCTGINLKIRKNEE